MVIGIPRESKAQEYRVALLPWAVQKLSRAGHHVIIQSGAGAGAGYSDSDYLAAGGHQIDLAAEVFGTADLVVKVKEPIPPEFGLLRPQGALFCYIHSETRPELTHALLERRITGIAFENVVLADGSRPLLAPMSVIAGQQAVLQAMQFLCNHRGGVGVSLVRYVGLPPAKVLVLGGGNAGEQAARVAAALGAEVTLVEVNPARLNHLARVLPAGVRLLLPGTVAMESLLASANMVVHATTIPAGSPEHLITRAMLAVMQPGSMIVDITANLGGGVESVDRYTTHAEPVYVVDGILHYVVSNIPGTVARTASQALCAAVFPYVRELSDLGPREALRRNPALRDALTCIDGTLAWGETGAALGLPWTPPATVLAT